MQKIGINEYKERILDILVKVDKICRENNYVYVIFYGTLLGAVRHKGFIPWDDDIDIVMPREDYYKLGEYIINHPELGLNYIDIKNRKDTIYYCAKVCDSETVVKESRYKQIKGYGAFIDVFPLDYLPEEEDKRIKQQRKELFWVKLLQHSAELSPGKGVGIKQKILKNIAFLFAKFFDTEKIISEMHQRYILFNAIPTRYMGVPWESIPFEAQWFNDRVEVEFEGKKFFAPAEMKKVLSLSYGNYMQLPSEEDRIYKHHLECYKIDKL